MSSIYKIRLCINQLLIITYGQKEVIILARNSDDLEKTLQQYDRALGLCRDVFVKKASDYGLSWRVLRPASIADQMYIKAKRIRTLEENKSRQIDEAVDQEYIGLVNYGIMALIQINHEVSEESEVSVHDVIEWYDHEAAEIRMLLIRKNTDYGEAWRDMRISSYTDMILMKLLRVREIEQNDGKTLISEGVPANYQDMVNYALFALIKLEEANVEQSK